MNAVEKLEAAIAKLEELRDQSSLGPWCAWKLRGNTGRMTYGIEDAYGEDIAVIRSSPESELIEILHRTVDAQLAILRHALGLLRDGYYVAAAPTEIALADAILGVSDADIG